MFLEQRFSRFQPPSFNLPTNTVLGTTQRWAIDRTWPIEEIIIQVGFTVTTGLTMAPATAQSPDAFDNILQLVQKINLSVNQGNQPRSVVDISGVGLLEYCSHTGANFDPSTAYLIDKSQGTSLGTGAYRITYRVPCAPMRVADPLRSRLYLPVHTYPQDPVLSLTFNTVAGMGCSAGVIGNVYVDVVLIRRVPTAASEKALQATAVPGFPSGYVDWDLIETPFSIGVGVGTEQRFPIPVPGQYLDLVMRQYKGGANITRNVIDGSGAGDTVANGFGNESRWRLETGGQTIREWKWFDLRAINAFSMPRNHLTQTVAPFFGGGVLASTNFQPGSSTNFDFLVDGLTGDTGVELGSLLDCNTPSTNGLKMEIVGTPASVATNASYLYVSGRRFFGDLSRWQKVS